MSRKPPSLTLHPSCPKRLITALRRAKGENGKGWNFTVLARQLSDETLTVNKGTIHKLVTKGIEPAGEALRVRLLLSKHPRKRVGDCSHCGKRVEVMKNGTLESHVKPDGLYCPGSDTREFLRLIRVKNSKVDKPPKPVHLAWWGKLTTEEKHNCIFIAYQKHMRGE